jgi:acetate kinase
MRILSLNSGSSSLKLALYYIGHDERLMLSGSIRGIGLNKSLFHIEDGDSKILVDQRIHLSEWETSITTLLEWLRNHDYMKDLDAVGHRIVHGGTEYNEPHLVTSKLMKTLTKLVPFVPDHLPQELKVINVIGKNYKDLKQVVCFDTSFHRNMPRLAQIYALPRFLSSEGVIRYGFHGLSYEYILDKLRRDAGNEVAEGRIIIAHLGSGTSMVAVRDGESVDTTMGFTPTGGLMMSTRSGDLDPGVILYLLKEKELSSSAVGEMVNRQAGLLGVSGVSSDMKELLEKEVENPDAAEAVGLFCYQAKKFLGALAAILGGVDTLVFTGGIGENGAPIRERICKDMEFLGICLDPVRNKKNISIISRADSPVTVRVIKTNEELMIARHTNKCIIKMKKS